MVGGAAALPIICCMIARFAELRAKIGCATSISPANQVANFAVR